MGALTINIRKRGDDYFRTPSPLSPSFDPSYAPVSKKPRLSNSMNQNTVDFDRLISPKSVNSRISQYPESKPGFKRGVHAPVRSSRFGFSASKNKIEPNSSFVERSAVRMGNTYSALKSRLEKARISAIQTFRYVFKENEPVEKDSEKEVIEIDDDEKRTQDDTCDSDVLEVDAVDFQSGKWKEGNHISENSQELKGEMVERNIQSLDSYVDLDSANVKVESMENMNLMLLNQERDLLDLSSYRKLYNAAKKRDLSAYRKLYNSAMKRDDTLSDLNFSIEYTEKQLQRLQLLRPRKKVEEPKKRELEECFIPLTEDEEAHVTWALSNSNRRKVLVSHESSNIDLLGEKLQCLRPGAWLNDEVINLYLELLKEREKREPQKFLKCHFCNTFFYKKLTGGRGAYNFQSVRRWTTQRKLGYTLLECDKIFVPIHKEVHWCLAVINKRDQKFQYLDSLGGIDVQVMKILAKYYVDEVKDKCGKDIDVTSWEQEYVSDLPEQQNGFDCGMFMIKYADFYSRDLGLCFNQEHMPYFRKRTVKEILRLKAE